MENNYWSHFVPYQYSEEGKEGGVEPKGEVSWSGKREDRWQNTKGEELGGKKINFSNIAKYCTLDKSKEVQRRGVRV